MENRHGLLVDFQMTHATGTAERDMVPKLLDQARERCFHPKTLSGDKGYDTHDCVDDMRERRVTPHVARNTSTRRSAIDRRTTCHPDPAVRRRVNVTELVSCPERNTRRCDCRGETLPASGGVS